jgi:DNA-binding NarL/FixJ family response regulator
VLLARLTPLAAVGMRRMLADDGVEVVGQEDRPLAIEALARSLEPDAVVLALEAGGSRALCERIRHAAPGATVILWAAEEDLMQIVEPGRAAIREVPAGGSSELRRELILSQTRHAKE